MDLQDFRIFSRVAAVQNLTAVGYELGLTPGTISKRLQALESQLQVRLFDRTTRSVRITAEGLTFLEHVERILLDVEKARASIGDYAARPQGTLRICAPNCLGRHELGPAMADFMHRYPEIDISIALNDRQGSLLDEGFDVALRIGELTDSALIVKRIGTLDQMLTAAPSYLAMRGHPRIPEDLTEHSCLIMCDAANWTFVPNSSVTRAIGPIRVNGRFRSNSAALLLSAAIQGHGILRCSQDWVRDELDRGRLVPVMSDFSVDDDLAIYAVYPSAKHVLPRVRVLLDFLTDWFRERRRCNLRHATSLAAE